MALNQIDRKFTVTVICIESWIGFYYIQGDHQVKIGMLLTLRMELPEEKMPLEIEQAVVQWVSGEDFGVRIKKIRRSAAIKLERLMGHHLCILPPVEH